jgi:hypothetical protein
MRIGSAEDLWGTGGMLTLTGFRIRGIAEPILSMEEERWD